MCVCVCVCVCVFGGGPENIAHLAETALRFLELVQENQVVPEGGLEEAEEALHPSDNYDSGTLHLSPASSSLSLSLVPAVVAF